jgi:hypothetical protein
MRLVLSNNTSTYLGAGRKDTRRKGGFSLFGGFLAGKRTKTARRFLVLESTSREYYFERGYKVTWYGDGASQTHAFSCRYQLNRAFRWISGTTFSEAERVVHLAIWRWYCFLWFVMWSDPRRTTWVDTCSLMRKWGVAGRGRHFAF